MKWIVNFRSYRTVTDSNLIIGVNRAVTIYIFIFDIPRHYSAEILCRTTCNIRFIFEKSFSYQTIYLIQPIPCLHQIIVQTRFFHLFLDLIPVPRKVSTDIKHYITDLFRIVQTDFRTPTIYNSRILERGIHT